MPTNPQPIRVLLAKLGLDTHTVGVTVIAHALREAGMEVIFTGLKQTPEMVANTAIQEDVDVVGVSSLSAGHLRNLPRLAELLREKGGGVFIRSMASRGQLGGLSRATFDAVLVLDAMGYDVIMVETVGVGQDEIDVVRLAHSTVIVNVPGMGDEIQAVKAGLMEAGEIFVVNKADRDGSEHTLRQLELMLHLREQTITDGDWKPPLLPVVATKGEGLVQLVDALDAHAAHLRTNGGFEARFETRSYHLFLALLKEGAAARLLDDALKQPATATVINNVRARRIDPYSAADALVAQITLHTSTTGYKESP